MESLMGCYRCATKSAHLRVRVGHGAMLCEVCHTHLDVEWKHWEGVAAEERILAARRRAA